MGSGQARAPADGFAGFSPSQKRQSAGIPTGELKSTRKKKKKAGGSGGGGGITTFNPVFA